MKTKRGKTKKLTYCYDRPSIKGTDVTFLLPTLEVHIWPSNTDILDTWNTARPDMPLSGELFGWWGSSKTKGSVVIHARSVRSHGSREEFYNTLGHELTHVLEAMEKSPGQPAGSLFAAQWKRLWENIRGVYYVTKKTFADYIRRRICRGNPEVV